MSNYRKKIDRYTIHLDEKLGVGSFGTVYVGYQDGTKDKVAVKMLDKKIIDKEEYIKKALFTEIDILKALKSPNIVGFLDVMESTNNYYIVQEFCDGGDLRGYMKKKGKIEQQQAIMILTQICNGFVEILKEGVIHRDLKPENILLNKGVVKVCDFGFSKKGNSQKMKNQTAVGTPLYMSVEILKGEPYTSKCDIWALGFIFYEMIFGETPWDAPNEYQLIKNIENMPLKFQKSLSLVTEDFLRKCLGIKQKDRISWDELLRHQIFCGAFTNEVKKGYEFQNKFKALMSKIRYHINSQNIELESLMMKCGVTINKQMDFTVFQKFMKMIDANLTGQELRYAFDKLDRDESNTISVEEVEAAMRENNINVRTRYALLKKNSFSEQLDAETIQKRARDAFIKLNRKLKERNLTLQQVFTAYDVNKDGHISFDEFHRIMKRLDNAMFEEDMKLVFKMIDTDDSSTITFEQFDSFLRKSISDSIQGDMKGSRN